MVAPWRAEISGNYWKGGTAGRGKEVRAQRDQRPTARLAPAPARTGPAKTDHYRQRTRAAGDQPAQNEHGSTLLQKKARPRPGFWFAKRLLAGLAGVFLLVDLGFRLGLGAGLRRLGFLRGLYVSLLGRLRGRGGRLSGRSRLPFGSGRLRFLRLS